AAAHVAGRKHLRRRGLVVIEVGADVVALVKVDAERLQHALVLPPKKEKPPVGGSSFQTRRSSESGGSGGCGLWPLPVPGPERAHDAKTGNEHRQGGGKRCLCDIERHVVEVLVGYAACRRK